MLVKLSDKYMLRVDPSLFQEIKELFGKDAIETRCAPVKDKPKKKNKSWKKKN